MEVEEGHVDWVEKVDKVDRVDKGGNQAVSKCNFVYLFQFFFCELHV